MHWADDTQNKCEMVWNVAKLLLPRYFQYLKFLNLFYRLNVLIVCSKFLTLVASVSEQAGLSLTWSETPEDRFSRDVVHMHSSSKFTPRLNIEQ